MVERAIGSVHVVGGEHTPLGWAGNRPTECVGRRPQTFTSTTRPLVRPVHLEAGPVVRPQNHEPAFTSWLNFGRSTTRASLSPFVSTVDAFVGVSFCGVRLLSDPHDCRVRIGCGLPIDGTPRGRVAADDGNLNDRSACSPEAFVPTGGHTRWRGMSRSRVAASATQRSHRSPSDFDGVPRANTDTN
jgi:hypothetical protein